MRRYLSKYLNEEKISALSVLGLVGLIPLAFPAGQAGLAKFSELALWVLLPALLLIGGVVVAVKLRHHEQLLNRIATGAIAGSLATLALELVRQISFHQGWMPGDMPRLIGVLITDRFMLGPSGMSDFLGYAYHFVNGAAFGIIFSVSFGKRPIWASLVWGQFIGLGLLVSPVVDSMGIGFMGIEMPSMPATVVVAHLAWGLAFGIINMRWTAGPGWIFSPVSAMPAQSIPPTLEIATS